MERAGVTSQARWLDGPAGRGGCIGRPLGVGRWMWVERKCGKFALVPPPTVSAQPTPVSAPPSPFQPQPPAPPSPAHSPPGWERGESWGTVKREVGRGESVRRALSEGSPSPVPSPLHPTPSLLPSQSHPIPQRPCPLMCVCIGAGAFFPRQRSQDCHIWEPWVFCPPSLLFPSLPRPPPGAYSAGHPLPPHTAT